jgi:hypothetical protein
MNNCKVQQLLILYPNSNDFESEEMKEILLKTVTRCKCQDHINENPIKLPTISELDSRLSSIIMEVLDWSIDHMYEDTTNNAYNLALFIQNHCLSESANSMFSIIENLVKLYPDVQEDDHDYENMNTF